MIYSKDDGGKSIESKEFKTVLKECGQNPTSQELENFEKDLQSKGKTHLTLDETLKSAQVLWKDNVKYLLFNSKF
jgi:Ca2+-binding EF-hand superfamily protein